MRRARMASWLVFAGTLLLVVCSGMSESLLEQWRNMNGVKGLDKLIVSVDPTADPNGASGLTIVEADKLASKWNGASAYFSHMTAAVAAGERKVTADVIGVGGQYDSFAHIRLYSGSIFAAKSVEEHSRAALVSARLAEQLFANRDVVGMSMQLSGSTFTIVGVYEQPDTLLDWMTDNGKPDLLVPLTTLSELNGSLKVATFELEAGAAAMITGKADVSGALLGLGKQPSRYKIVNLAAERKWVGQKPKLLLAAAGTAALLLCARLVKRKLYNSVALLRRGTATEDWSDVIRRHRNELALAACTILALAVCAAALWLVIRQRVYIPAEYVPDVLIDWTFYRDRWLEWWQHQVQSRGYIPSAGELIYERVNALVTRLTVIGLIVGLPLLWIGVREWTVFRISLEGRLVRLAYYFAVAVIVAAAVAWWAGVEFAIRWRELLVFGCLFGLAAMPVGKNDLEKANKEEEWNYVEIKTTENIPTK